MSDPGKERNEPKVISRILHRIVPPPVVQASPPLLSIAASGQSPIIYSDSRGHAPLATSSNGEERRTRLNDRRPNDSNYLIIKQAAYGSVQQPLVEPLVPVQPHVVDERVPNLYESPCMRRQEEEKVFELSPRRISIFLFDIERSLDDRQNLIFRVTCSKGTYIRSLCADLGKALGSCAHLTALRRDSIGEYSTDNAWDFKELEDAITKTHF